MRCNVSIGGVNEAIHCEIGICKPLLVHQACFFCLKLSGTMHVIRSGILYNNGSCNAMHVFVNMTSCSMSPYISFFVACGS